MKFSFEYSLLTLILSQSLLFFSGCTSGADQNTETGQQQPNILLIVADDFGYTDLSVFRGDIDTPNLDSMFFISTRFNFGDRFSTVALDNLNSNGIDIIRNKELRNQIILTYEAYPYLKEAQNIYTDIILSAGKDLLNTRFVELWDGDASNDDVTGTMHPLNYNELLTDQEFLYFLRSLPNHMVYFVERPVEYTLTRIESSLQMIESELNK